MQGKRAEAALLWNGCFLRTNPTRADALSRVLGLSNETLRRKPPKRLGFDVLAQQGSPLLTDELLEWASVEGVSLDWIVFGHVGGPMAVYREKYKMDDPTRQFQEAVRQLNTGEQGIRLEGVKRAAEDGADMEESEANQ